MSETEQKAPRILVADDDPQVLRPVQTILKAEGYGAITARRRK